MRNVACHHSIRKMMLLQSSVYHLQHIHSVSQLLLEPWFGLTLIYVFHLLAHLPSHSGKFPISPSISGQTDNGTINIQVKYENMGRLVVLVDRWL